MVCHVLDVTDVYFILFMCLEFDYVRTCYINVQGVQGREFERKLANQKQDKGSPDTKLYKAVGQETAQSTC